MRRKTTIALLLLFAAALVAQRASAPLRREGLAPDPALAAVQASEEATTVIGRARDGTAVFSYSLDDWRSWARSQLEAELGPVRIGDQAMAPESFDRFGAAELCPDGERVLVGSPPLEAGGRPDGRAA
jgi:hypothetical protein